MTEDDREEPVTVPFVTPQARLTSLLFRTGLRFDSSWDSTVWMTWGTSDDGIFYLFITDYIFKIENIYLCVEQKRFGGHGVHWSSILMFPLGVGIPRFAHKPCGRQLSACGLSWYVGAKWPGCIPADHHQAGHERCHGLRDSCSAITNAKFRSEDYVCTHFVPP